jgi:hypothetical protein
MSAETYERCSVVGLKFLLRPTVFGTLPHIKEFSRDCEPTSKRSLRSRKEHFMFRSTTGETKRLVRFSLNLAWQYLKEHCLRCVRFLKVCSVIVMLYRGADKSLARPNSRCILFDGENISFDASLYIYSTNIPPIMIINRMYETQDLL